MSTCPSIGLADGRSSFPPKVMFCACCELEEQFGFTIPERCLDFGHIRPSLRCLLLLFEICLLLELVLLVGDSLVTVVAISSLSSVDFVSSPVALRCVLDCYDGQYVLNSCPAAAFLASNETVLFHLCSIIPVQLDPGLALMPLPSCRRCSVCHFGRSETSNIRRTKNRCTLSERPEWPLGCKRTKSYIAPRPLAPGLFLE